MQIISNKQKENAENKGYSLINQYGGLFHSVMVYGKEE